MFDQSTIKSLDKLVHKLSHKRFVLPLPHRQILLILEKEKTANLSQLAKLRGVRKSSMSVMLDQLTEQQLIIKANAKSDKRQRYYLLSRNGRSKLSEDIEQYNQWLNKILSGYDDSQRQLITQFLQRLAD